VRPSAENVAATLRGRIPRALVPFMVAARFRVAWSRSSMRDDARAQMHFLLEHTRPDADLEAVARAYVRNQIWRGELRWHPEMITRLRVAGIEHLIEARERGRGVMLNFVHHGHYDGAFPSMARLGVQCHMVVYPYMLDDRAPGWLRQHVRVASIGGGVVVSAGAGTDGITALLRRGEVVAIASDVPGRTPLRFVGRDVLGSSGAARLAATTNSPVVVMTFDRDEKGPLVRLHEPLEPERYDAPMALLGQMLAIHESALVRWPEWTDLPLSRWGSVRAEATHA
jgi:lauroyl/myristoyl acyltransferase